jgi:hypothetical protein
MSWIRRESGNSLEARQQWPLVESCDTNTARNHHPEQSASGRYKHFFYVCKVGNSGRRYLLGFDTSLVECVDRTRSVKSPVLERKLLLKANRSLCPFGDDVQSLSYSVTLKHNPIQPSASLQCRVRGPLIFSKGGLQALSQETKPVIVLLLLSMPIQLTPSRQDDQV